MAILVVDDDPVMCELLARSLHRTGYPVITAPDGERGLELFSTAPPDLVVLDLMLPGIDGFGICRRIRLESQVPIILVTARGDEETVIQAFHLGVDDYVTKPCSMPLLVARVTGLLRRTTERKRQSQEAHIKVDGLELDVQSHELRQDGLPVQLTPLEFRLFHLLLANQGRVVPYGRLIEFAWGHGGGNPTSLKIRIHGLRKKLGFSASDTPGIKAVTGTGYVFQVG
jgi:DNA-binding response OmpR family regulator